MKLSKVFAVALIAGMGFLFSQPAISEVNDCVKVIERCQTKLKHMNSSLKRVTIQCKKSGGDGCIHAVKQLRELIERTKRDCERDVKEACS